MKNHLPKSICRLALAVAALALVTGAPRALALIVGPYSPDAGTLHLWHLDAPSGITSTDSVASGSITLTNNQAADGSQVTLGNAAASGFANCLHILATNINAGGTRAFAVSNANANINSFKNPTSGAFTFEALVNFDGYPTNGNGNGSPTADSGWEIISGDSGNTSRSWQFRINAGRPGTNVARLELNFITPGGNQYLGILPNAGPDAVTTGKWYHVAATYSGNAPTNGDTAGVLKFYWTSLDAANTTATLLTNFTQGTLGTLGGTPVIGIGGNARTTGGIANGEGFKGFIDEARISQVARTAGQMMFVAPVITFDLNPSNTVVAVGQSASFNASAIGVPPLYYQWRHEGTNLPGATATSYSIAATAAPDAGNYDVVVTNASTSATSAVAVLTVRTPANLTWGVSPASSSWNTSDVNWDSNGDTLADAAFTPGDNVLFDDVGIGNSAVTIPATVIPSVVTVSNTSGSYTFTTSTGGGIANNGRLIKGGAGSLTLDTDNTYSGSTVINNGILFVGAGAARGSLGSGPVTNHTGLLFNRTGNVTLGNTLDGEGGVTNLLAAAITLSGTNTLTGTVAANAGAFTLVGSQSKGGCTNFVLEASLNSAGATRLTLSGGVTLDANTTVSLLDTAVSPDNRCSFTTSDSTNTVNAALIPTGGGAINVAADGTSLFLLNGPMNSPAFNGKIILRGNGTGVFSSAVNIGGHVSKTDGGTWTLTSTGNTWTNTDCAGGMLRLGTNNAISTSATVNMAGGILDLAGYNQQVTALAGASATSLITNSSATSDSTLSCVGGPSTLAGLIRDGTRQINLSVNTADLTLSNAASHYKGFTTLVGGSTLRLANPILDANSLVSVGNLNTLELNFAATNSVGSLVLGGATQPPGVYNNSTSPTFITGTGSLLVLANYPTNISSSVSGSTLTLSWPATHLGWILQSQTNSITTGIVTNANAWFDWPGSAAATSTNLSINPANPTVFFRLRHP